MHNKSIVRARQNPEWRTANTQVKRLFFAAAALVCVFLPNSAKASQQTTLCTPSGVMAYSTGSARVHVQCAAPVGNISYFAVSGADAAVAARILSVASTALVSGRTLTIWYDPADLSGQNIGCQNTDCRLILGIGFGK